MLFIPVFIPKCYVVIIVVVSALVCTNPLLEVHINVNVSLREKLVSEVRGNRDKVKKTTGECINSVFAYICEQTALATLKIYFPPVKIWRVKHLKTTHNQYIDVYLDIIFMPVIEATKDLEILSLALKLIGEALLEHIYAKRIKFTVCGAINLMKDFDGIAKWIETCALLEPYHRNKLSKHEVLKVCEGVGKVRKGENIISANGNLSNFFHHSFFVLFSHFCSSRRFFCGNQMRLFSFITPRSRLAKKVKRVPQQMMVNLFNIFIGIVRH